MKFKSTSSDSRVRSLRLLLALACLLPLLALAAPPGWWTDRQVLDPNAAKNDFGSVNQGQLKNMAKKAYAELRNALPSEIWTKPEGKALAALVDSWNPAQTGDFDLINQGQLKAVAKKFYDVLILHGYTNAYPWTGATTAAANDALANLGQLKNLFSFDVPPAQLVIGVPNDWQGWNNIGLSNQLGVYGSGYSSSALYDVYANQFYLNAASGASRIPVGNRYVTGNPAGFTYSPGAFTGENRILGIGVQGLAGSSVSGFWPTVKFALGDNTYSPATSVPGTDGRVSFSLDSQPGDFTVQFEGSQNLRPSSITFRGNDGYVYTLPGGIGSGASYDFAFRAIPLTSSNSYQMFFDLTKMQEFYSNLTEFQTLFNRTNVLVAPGTNYNGQGIGAIGSKLTIALNGLSNNTVVFSVADPEKTIPSGIDPKKEPTDNSTPAKTPSNYSCENKENPGDPNSGASGTCGKDKCPTNHCIRHQMTIAFAPNEPGLGAGLVQYYVEATDANLGSRSYLGFFGVQTMDAVPTDLGNSTSWRIFQAGGITLTFVLPDQLPAGQTGYIEGKPVGTDAFTQARITYIQADGSPAAKSNAVYLRQYRAGEGTVDYPVAGGKAVRFATNAGRTYALPFADLEVIRDRTTGDLVVNGSRHDGLLRQVKTVGGLLDIVPLSARSFEIRKYAPSQIGAKLAGLYTVTGIAHEVLHFEAAPNTQGNLTVVHSIGTEQYTTVNTITGDATGETWSQTNTNGGFQWNRVLKKGPTPADGNGVRTWKWTAKLTAAPDAAVAAGGDPDYVLETVTQNSAPVSSTQKFKSGVQKQRTWSYSGVPWDPNGVGDPEHQVTSTGTQVDYQYDPQSRRMLSRTFTVSFPATGGAVPVKRRETYDYAALAAGEVSRPFDFRPRTTSFYQDDVLVGKTYNSYRIEGGEYVETEERVASVNAPFGDPGNRRHETRYYGAGADLGRVKEVRSEDGTLTRYSYAALAENGLQITATRMLTAQGVPVNGYSTRSVEVLDARAWPVTVTNAHWVGGAWLDYEKITEARDVRGQLLSRTRLDLLSGQSRTLLEQTWDGDQLTRMVDADGVATSYEYYPGTNILLRQRREAIPAAGAAPAQPEVVTTYSGSYSMDAAQMPVRNQPVTTVSSGGLTLTSSTLSDETGRMLSDTDVNGYTTTYQHSDDDSVSTTIRPTGATEVVTQSSVGEVISRTGTGVIAEYHVQAPVAAGGTAEAVYVGQPNSARWTYEERDAAGRTARTVRPAFGGQTAETVYQYDQGGRPSIVTTTGLPNTINQYNEVGALVRSGTSGDGPTLSVDSPTDRIQDSLATVERSGNVLWQVSRSSIYATAGNGTATALGTQRTMLAGFAGNQVGVSETVDIAGNLSRSTMELDRGTHLSVSRSTVPGVSDAPVSVSCAGRQVSTHQPGSTGDVTYGYDALGRRVSIQQPGHAHAETSTYSPGTNLLASQADATGAATSYAYVPQGQPGAGRVRSVTAADGGVTTTTYDLLGRVTGTSGARTYPVSYGFDGFGQLQTMTTWKDFAGQNGAAATTWTREPATGLLLAKTDAAGKAVTYTYDAAGRLLTRTWARGVVTTYTYDPMTRDLSGVSYSDGTPAVTITDDRLGRQVSVTTAGTAQSVFTYRADNLLPDTETVRQDVDGDGTSDFERVFTRSYDALLRPAGFALKMAGAPANEASVSYGYEAAAGRFASVTAQPAQGVQGNPAFAYAYDPARPGLLASVTSPAHTVVNTWEPDRNVLKKKTNLVGNPSTGSAVSAFDYSVNAIGQRTSVGSTGSAFAAATGWTWGYDALGQVTSAAHATDTARNRAFTFDDIGNRKASSVGFQPTNTTTYTANALNQYASITPPAAAAFTPSYDADGNQLSTVNPQPSTYEWDGENRLKVVRDAQGNAIASYAYDSQSRRVRKALFAPGATSATSVTGYVYDSWNLVAEFNLLSPPGILLRRHTWGLDLSGSMQGAGGVGGLLVTESLDAANLGTWFPLYDGNGNLTDLLTRDTALAAHYEYGPFGELIAGSGPAAQVNPFRFSTKYQDVETGLLYYGYRYYDPVSGRWPSRDPLGEETFRKLFSRGKSKPERTRLFLEGVKSYLFAANGPISKVDRLGLDAGITGGGAHTGIQVEVRNEAGTVVGWLEADFHAEGYMGDNGKDGSSSSSNSSGSSSSSSGSSGSGGVVNGAGRLLLTYCPGPARATARKVPGGVEQDNRLIDFILKTAGLDRSWLKTTCDRNRLCQSHTSTGNGFEKYRVLTQNCNDFTDAALDVYLGYNWCWELITDADDLLQQWDERFDQNGKKR